MFFVKKYGEIGVLNVCMFLPQCRSTGTRACPLNAAELQPSVDLAKLCWTFAAVLAHLHCFVPGSILPYQLSRTVTVWLEIHHINRIKHRRKGCVENMNISRENMRKLTFLPLLCLLYSF